MYDDEVKLGRFSLSRIILSRRMYSERETDKYTDGCVEGDLFWLWLRWLGNASCIVCASSHVEYLRCFQCHNMGVGWTVIRTCS